MQRINNHVAVLRQRPAIGHTEVDRHPGSPNMVDLVHPSLYCYEKGKTLVLPNVGAEAVHQPDNWEAFAGAGVREEPGMLPGIYAHRRSVQGLQWLPSEFHVNEQGTACEIRSYINNLHPKQDSEIYQSISELFLEALPVLEATLTESKAQMEHPTPQRVPVNPCDWWKDPLGEFRAQKEGEEDREYYRCKHEWFYKNRQMEPPQIVPFTEPTKKPEPVSLRGRPLQAIVKIATLELDAGEEYVGSWHVEGTLDDRIVATACCYLESTNVEGGELEFRESFDDFPWLEQCDDDGAKMIYDLDMEELKVSGQMWTRSRTYLVLLTRSSLI